MTAHWQQILSQGFRDAKALLAYRGISLEHADIQAQRLFPTRVPKGFADRIRFGDPFDPILRQILAVSQEHVDVPGFVKDPLNEEAQNPIPGLIHKYHGRVLLTVAGACAVNCRYCFRRHFNYQQNNPGTQGWQQAFDYIQSHTDIKEVIFSGGDPLLASDATLFHLISTLETIPHVTTIRFHTRIPIVLPERMTQDFLERLKLSPLNMVMVLHSNHPNELSAEVDLAMQRIRQAGLHILNQSVLLSGVNDEASTLIELSHRLFKMGILPYYLHTLDKVSGAAHFDMSDEQAITLHQQMQCSLPGYLVPKLVTEQPGVAHKVLVYG